MHRLINVIIVLAVGRRIGTYTSFQNHGSYFTDLMMTQVPVTGLYGATSAPFVFNDNHNGVEVNGVLADRFGLLGRPRGGHQPRCAQQ